MELKVLPKAGAESCIQLAPLPHRDKGDSFDGLRVGASASTKRARSPLPILELNQDRTPRSNHIYRGPQSLGFAETPSKITSSPSLGIPTKALIITKEPKLAIRHHQATHLGEIPQPTTPVLDPLCLSKLASVSALSTLFSPMAQPLLNKFYMSPYLVSANPAMSWGTLKPLVAKAHPSAKQGLKTFMKTQAVLQQTQWQLRINNHTIKGLLLTLLLTLCPLKWPPLKLGASPPRP
uniref:Uncharacterized protein n=1 Tax=Populus alba TaxID=43335 RepID=A0A4V6A789_POPAL|nr:hypothetical protein D5086_0000205840 [Populus alba]